MLIIKPNGYEGKKKLPPHTLLLQSEVSQIEIIIFILHPYRDRHYFLMNIYKKNIVFVLIKCSNIFLLTISYKANVDKPSTQKQNQRIEQEWFSDRNKYY